MSLCGLLQWDFLHGTGRHDECGAERYSDSDLDFAIDYAHGYLEDGYTTDLIGGFDLSAFAEWCECQLYGRVTMTRKEWYARVNAAWPSGPLPSLTGQEAVDVAAKLTRFAIGNYDKGFDSIVETSGRRETWVYGRVLYVNPAKGWHDLVHSLSHWCHRMTWRAKGHDSSHARMELRMIREVIKRGWLDGRLRKPEKAAPTREEKREKRLAGLNARLDRWEKKQRRAETAIKKLKRQIRDARRAIATAS